MAEEKKNEKINLLSGELNACRGDLGVSVDLNEAQRINNAELRIKVERSRKALKIVSGGFGAALVALIFAIIF
jgi:type IV secretory pathway component VirB8